MINNHFPTVFGVLVVLAALAAPAHAAQATPDPSTQREFAAKLKVCTACHGENGVPKGATIPVILGQQENYLAKQLHDFESGKRNIEVMTWMAKSLSQEELKALTGLEASGLESAAAYFANYLGFNGKSNLFESLLPRIFSSAELDSITKFT